jgi:glycosyltransferase involved in cell wall biosynthesis
MRIVLVDPLGYTTPYDDRLASALAHLGHDVHFLTAPFVLDAAPTPDGYVREELFVPVANRLLRGRPRARLRRVLKGAEYLPSVWRLRRRIRALDPDVTHVQWLVRPELDIRWLRSLAARRTTLFTAHNAFPRRQRAFPAWRDALEAVDHVIVHSHQAVDRLAELGVERERMTVIPHPVFDAPVEVLVEPPSGRRMLFFGLIRRYKGLDLLVTALPQVLEHVPDARLVVAGDPLEPIDPVRTLASSLGVEHAIEWQLQFVPDTAVAPLLASSAFLVLPYREIESSGVLALAFGHGRPAVVSDLGAVGEHVREFGAGRAVPAEDVPALASACVELLTDAAALRRAFEGALEARRTLTWEASARRHEQVYEEAASERRRASVAT